MSSMNLGEGGRGADCRAEDNSVCTRASYLCPLHGQRYVTTSLTSLINLLIQKPVGVLSSLEG